MGIFSSLRRVSVAMVAILVVWILSLFIDAAVLRILDIVGPMIGDGIGEPVVESVDMIAVWIPRLLYFGIIVWLIWATVREQRYEEQVRQVRQP